MINKYLLTQFGIKLAKLIPETYKYKVRGYSNSLTLQDFDNIYLKPSKFPELCELLAITPKKLYDKYYSFVFSNYGKALVQYREANNLSQKQFARISNISPVDIGFFERGTKYPTRQQYIKLKEVLEKHAKSKGTSIT